MTKTKILYQGELRTLSTHESGSTLETDAPKDNQGKGERFSPTDLLVVSLGTCMLTLMGISAKKLKLDLSRASAEVEKEMSTTPPRRISKILVSIQCPITVSDEARTLLERVALACPVKQSLHPEIEIKTDFIWGPRALE